MKLTPAEYLNGVLTDAIRLFTWELEYTRIETNKYPTTRQKKRQRPSVENGATCEVNESCFIECQPDCVGCVNNQIRQGLNTIALEVALVRNAGRAVFALQDIPKKTKIIEYLGEIITKPEVLKRLKQNNGNYIMKTKDIYVDAKKYGNTSRFINHSCDPNCQVEEWYVDDLPRLVIVANKPIRTGEQLTFDYGRGGDWGLICKCGTKKCRKII